MHEAFPMSSASNHPEVIRDGLVALKSLLAILQLRHSESSYQFKGNVVSLIGRLDDTTMDEWAMGAVRTYLSPIDLATTDECISEARRLSPYQDQGADPTVVSLTALSLFLSVYLMGFQDT
jgi:hypothetical protein